MNTRIAILAGGVAAFLAVNAAQADPAANIAAPASVPSAHLQLAHYHHRHGGFWPGAIIGGIIGGALAAAPPAYYYGPPPPPAYYYGPPPDSAVAYCERRYRSYDPATGTYLGYDGYRHPCP